MCPDGWSPGREVWVWLVDFGISDDFLLVLDWYVRDSWASWHMGRADTSRFLQHASINPFQKPKAHYTFVPHCVHSPLFPFETPFGLPPHERLCWQVQVMGGGYLPKTQPRHGSNYTVLFGFKCHQESLTWDNHRSTLRKWKLGQKGVRMEPDFRMAHRPYDIGRSSWKLWD